MVIARLLIPEHFMVSGKVVKCRENLTFTSGLGSVLDSSSISASDFLRMGHGSNNQESADDPRELG